LDDDDDDNVNGVGSITEGPLFLFFDLTDVVIISLHDNGEGRYDCFEDVVVVVVACSLCS